MATRRRSSTRDRTHDPVRGNSTKAKRTRVTRAKDRVKKQLGEEGAKIHFRQIEERRQRMRDK